MFVRLLYWFCGVANYVGSMCSSGQRASYALCVWLCFCSLGLLEIQVSGLHCDSRV